MKLTHADLVKLAVKWLRNIHGCPVVISELTTASRETPDAIGFKDVRSWLIECKISRSDFKSDSGKDFRNGKRFSDWAMGRMRYYLAPVGLIKREELPEKWGLLETNGKEINEVIPATFREDTTRDFEIELLVSALRRVSCQPKVDGVMVKIYRSNSDEAQARIYVDDELSDEWLSRYIIRGDTK